MANSSAKKLATSQRKRWLSILQTSAARQNHGEKILPSSVVIDANVWVSAIMHGGNSEKAVVYCLEQLQIIASETIKEELIDYFKTQTTAPQRWRRQFSLQFERTCTIVTTEDRPIAELRDPADIHVLRAAIEQEYPLIITGDKDLLDIGIYRGIAMLSPVEFLELVADQR